MSNSSRRCLVCQSTELTLWASSWDREYKTSENRYQFFKCARCEVVSISPLPTDKLAEIYPDSYYSYSGAITEGLLFKIKGYLSSRHYRKVLSSLPNRELRMLDVGGGWGYEASLVRRCDSRVSSSTVLDLDSRNRARAEAEGHTYVCTGYEVYQPQEPFDFILALNVLEHIAEPRLLLERCYGWLGSGGLLQIATPSTDGLDAKLFRTRDWGGLHCPRHWGLFNERSLKKLAEDVGFRVREFSYIQGASFWSLSTLFFLEDKRVVTISPGRPAMYHPLYPVFAVPYVFIDALLRAVGHPTSQMRVILERG